ncbi:MAG: recombinase family protein [Paucibacter sp.]|nr:recombinase family protein [Roseateles sp.]
MAAGGAAFGYRLVKGPEGSAIEIDPAAASVVQRIFNDFASGLSPQRIAHGLNAARIPSPRNGAWSVSAIYGSPKKGAGILNNELYVGQQIWNRSQWLTHPDTRDRERRERPQSEWTIIERPELRIIDDHTWNAVRARVGRRKAAQSKGGRPPRTMFGGQLRCPLCGGAMIAVNGRSYGCGKRKDRGPTVCSNGALVPRKQVDAGLLNVVRHEVMAPAAKARFEQTLRDALHAETTARQDKARIAQQEARLKDLSGEIARIVDAIVKIGMSEALGSRLKRLEEEKLQLEAMVLSQNSAQVDVEGMVEETMRSYSAVVATIEVALAGDIMLTREAFSKLLGRITLSVNDDGSVWAEFENKTARLPSGVGLPAYLTVVAGAGFEPTTFGL